MTQDHTIGLVRFGDDPSQPVRYGLGWRRGTLDGRSTLPGWPRVFEHDGASGCHLWIDPEWELVYVFLTNRYGLDASPSLAPLQAVYGALRQS